MKKVRCPICGAEEFDFRKEHLYSHQGQSLPVPAEVCLRCGTVFYDAKVLKEIEGREGQYRAQIERIRKGREADPDFEKAIEAFVEAEACLPDSLEGQSFSRLPNRES